MSPALSDFLSSLLETLAPATGRALKAFAGTLAGVFALGLVLAGVSYAIAAQGSPLRGGLAILASVVLACVLGMMLAMKRALAAALIHAIESLGLGSRGLQVVFEALLHVDEEEAEGERGVALAKTAENLPLVQAEERLKATVGKIVTAPGQGGGLGGSIRRKLVGVVFGKIEALTLAEFRREDQGSDGVNLIVVRDRLAETIDHLLLDTAASARTKLTLLLLAGLIAGSGLLAYGIGRLQV